jgi:hypothetical protein
MRKPGETGEVVKEFHVEKPDPSANAFKLQPVIRRLQTLDKLARDGDISDAQYKSGELYLGIVQTFYEVTSGFARASDASPHAGSDNDPIRLYIKGRRRYVATQRPRNVVRPKTNFDGWTVPRSNALKAMHRLRTCLRNIDGESLRALYALIIHPSDPNRLPTTLRAYTIQQHGYRNQRLEGQVLLSLCGALDDLHQEYGEPLEEAA